jgi:ankyrin repeat protein
MKIKIFDLRDANKDTPLHYLVENNNLEMISFLEEKFYRKTQTISGKIAIDHMCLVAKNVQCRRWQAVSLALESVQILQHPHPC